MKRIAWVFNGYMIWAAFSGWLIIEGLSWIRDMIQHARFHRGAQLGATFGLLFVGGSFWVMCAMAMRRAKAEADHQEACYKWADAYRKALLGFLDDPTRQRAVIAVNSCQEVRDALEDVHRAASRVLACQSQE